MTSFEGAEGPERWHWGRWILTMLWVGPVIGLAAAGFLWALDAVTIARFEAPGWLFALPLLGLVVAVVYEKFGGNSVQGANLLLAEIADPDGRVPRRIAPLVVFGTLMTHLGGGSAGREGTALQLGAGIAVASTGHRKMHAADRRLLIRAGMSAGFGAIFGTPFAGAVFALEVANPGRLRLRSAPICLLAAWLAHLTCVTAGAYHIHYPSGFSEFLPGPRALILWVAFAIAFGLIARGFTAATQLCAAGFRRITRRRWLHPVLGGLVVIALVPLAGSRDFLGLGTLGPRAENLTVLNCFGGIEIGATAWLWKLGFTAVTLGAGFQGGEVTPLFFIGAAGGHWLADLAGAPIATSAALGMVAVFAAATRTPLASIALGIEMFGFAAAVPMVLVCGVACLIGGRGGIYERPEPPLVAG